MDYYLFEQTIVARGSFANSAIPDFMGITPFYPTPSWGVSWKVSSKDCLGSLMLVLGMLIL
mgnify:CR=1 FL=1